MKTEEEYRPASLGRGCLREMQMEDYTHRGFCEMAERLIREKYGGQPFLPMWLPERHASPPLARE